MLIAVIFFLIISSVILMGVASPVLREVRFANDLIESKQSLYSAESGIEDVTYRILNTMSVGASESMNVLGYSTITAITDISGGKVILAEGNQGDYTRKVSTTIEEGEGVTFNYGLQAGAGGFNLSGSAGINGNVYANGDIISTGSNYVTGSAVAANSIALTADQSNESPASPPYGITFRNANPTQDVAQSFVPSQDGPVNKVAFYVRKVGAPANATVRISPNSGSNPGNSTLASGTLNASMVTGSYGWVEVVLSSNPPLQAGVTYWVVIDNGSSNSSNYYQIGENAGGYGGGEAKVGRFGNSWSDPATVGDIYFKIYLGGLNSIITGDWTQGFRIGTSGTGDAWAHTINNSQAPGTLYCKSGSGNNKSCDTSRDDPTATGMPISDSNIQQWKDDALAGGVHSGNYTVGGSSSVLLGPKKIEGNLVISNSGVLTVTGTLWVTGTITVDGAGKLRLDASYGENSGVIVSDGNISLTASGAVSGSGTAGSYIMLITTSNCPNDSACGTTNAIQVSGAAGSVILVAQEGAVKFEGSASAKAVTAWKMIMSGATTVNYESGITDASFSTGPSGGFSIDSWEETQ